MTLEKQPGHPLVELFEQVAGDFWGPEGEYDQYGEPTPFDPDSYQFPDDRLEQIIQSGVEWERNEWLCCYDTPLSLLHEAARLGWEKAVRRLIEQGEDPNSLSKFGMTALDACFIGAQAHLRIEIDAIGYPHGVDAEWRKIRFRRSPFITISSYLISLGGQYAAYKDCEDPHEDFKECLEIIDSYIEEGREWLENSPP